MRSTPAKVAVRGTESIMHPLSLLPLLLIDCQGYDNMQACWDWLNHACSEYDDQAVRRHVDCSVYDDVECDLAEYFDCLEKDYGCPLDQVTGVPTNGQMPCWGFATCE